MTKIKIRNGESLEQALRRFNREVQKAGIIDEVKERTFYEKPSERKRAKKKELLRKFKYEKKRG